MTFPSRRLSIADHDRDSSGMTYVYAVVSRRARGVSVGINLNPNNACNWRCIYCQVPNLKRGGPPPIDLGRLETELRMLLSAMFHGDYLERHAPPEARRVVDVAFSGNGEPTSAREFPAAVGVVARVLDEFVAPQPPLLRLITNGSLLGRRVVQDGIRQIGQRQGEVWFKIDGVGAETTRLINGVALQPDLVLGRLKTCASLCPTWVQSCFFALDGQPPPQNALARYLALLGSAREVLTGVHLYGLARPSQQPEAPRLKALPAEWFEAFAARIRETTGLTVQVSP
ncbi:MAG: radical SAM protein [Rhodocyclaceae bacterium]|nr:radical SAM protein [Rhodocyclaceae bacterium]